MFSRWCPTISRIFDGRAIQRGAIVLSVGVYCRLADVPVRDEQSVEQSADQRPSAVSFLRQRFGLRRLIFADKPIELRVLFGLLGEIVTGYHVLAVTLRCCLVVRFQRLICRGDRRVRLSRSSGFKANA